MEDLEIAMDSGIHLAESGSQCATKDNGSNDSMNSIGTTQQKQLNWKSSGDSNVVEREAMSNTGESQTGGLQDTLNDSCGSQNLRVSKIPNNPRIWTNSSSKELCHLEKDVLAVKKPPRPQPQQQSINEHQLSEKDEEKDDSKLLMFTSCGQLLLGLVLVVFGVLALVHGAALSGSGAGLWAGAGALVAGALGVVGTLASSSGRANSGFSTAHLAASLVALALSNMAAITALTAVVRDSQRPPEVTLLQVPGENGESIEVEGGWSGLLASIGLLVASAAELLVSGYTCLTLTPKLCGCLRPTEESGGGRLKTKNLVHQWVIAQNHVPKTPPVYLVQPVMQVHPIVQPAYVPGKFSPGGYVSHVALPGYGPMPPILSPPHHYAARPLLQMNRKQKRHVAADLEEGLDKRKHSNPKLESARKKPLPKQEVDLAGTYTGLDKKISEEFISIAMDPDRKSKASSCQGSEIVNGKTS